jgi:hypothetical protein
MPFVFVSHASPDKPLIRHVVDKLIASGLRVWVDDPARLGYGLDQIQKHFIHLHANRQWQDEIDEAIRKAGAVLVCFSRRFNEKRDMLQDEAAGARILGKLVACRIDDVDVQTLRNNFSLHQIADVRADRPERDLATALALLAKDVGAVLQATHRRAGAATKGNRHRNSVVKLLSPLAIGSDVFLPHYLRTVSDLGIPELAQAQELEEIIRELSSLRDKNLGMPRGLLQFLVRLSQESALSHPIRQWLDKNAAGQQSALADIRGRLAIEQRQKILAVIVEVDEKGKIAAFQPYLRNSDFAPVAGRTFARRSVAGWQAFQSALQDVLAEFAVNGALENLEIHFLADPPLFDAPFHSIPLTPGGPAIGEQAIVILRHRRRLLSSDLHLQKDWRSYAAALRPALPSRMAWLKIQAGVSLPNEKGPCFAAFLLAPPHAGGVPCENEKRLLSRLLSLGAPYLCWVHALPHGADWQTVEKELTELLADIPTIDGFPNKFRIERVRGSELATQASILWDDPLAKPFSALEGVGTR